MRRRWTKLAVLTLFLVASLFSISSPALAASSGQACKKAGLTTTSKSGGKKVMLTCAKVGKKLVWVKIPTTTTTIALKETVSQSNARRSAGSYLKFSSFSRSGLIKQLEYEKFSTADATYGVDALNTNWNEQAKKSAQSYLKFSSFSRSGLIDQLLYEGFTQGQAEYGVTATGL